MGTWVRKGKRYDVADPEGLRELTRAPLAKAPLSCATRALSSGSGSKRRPTRAVCVSMRRSARVAHRGHGRFRRCSGFPRAHYDASFKASRVLVADRDLQDKMDALRKQGRSDLVKELLERAEKAIKPATAD